MQIKNKLIGIEKYTKKKDTSIIKNQKQEITLKGLKSINKIKEIIESNNGNIQEIINKIIETRGKSRKYFLRISDGMNSLYVVKKIIKNLIYSLEFIEFLKLKIESQYSINSISNIQIKEINSIKIPLDIHNILVEMVFNRIINESSITIVENLIYIT